MRKTISYCPSDLGAVGNNIATLIYEGGKIANENIVISFFNSVYFFLTEIKPPSFIIKSGHAVIHPEIKLSDKVKLLMGLFMVATTITMLVNKLSENIDKQSLKIMLNLSGICINVGFGYLLMDGLMSKVKYACIMNNKITTEQSEVNDLEIISNGENVSSIKEKVEHSKIYLKVMVDMFAESICLFSALSIIVYAGLSFANEEPNEGPLLEFKKYMGVIKTSLFMIGHLIMSLSNHYYEQMNEQSKELLSLNIRSLWYRIDDSKLRFIEDYRNAGFFTNLVICCYSISTLIQGCDGPHGPNGEASCIRDSKTDMILYYFQAISLIWLAAPLMKKAISQLDDESFPISTKINQSCQHLITYYTRVNTLPTNNTH